MAFWNRWFGSSHDPPQRSARAEEPMPAFPFPIQRCRGVYVDSRFPQLRRQAQERGETLIVLGDDEDVRGLNEQCEFNEATPEEYLAQAAEVDVDEWLARRVELDPECYECEPGEWPSRDMRNTSMIAHLNHSTNKPKPQVYLATVPTPRSWEAPAYLRFGNWNECPDAHVHVALARRWHERFRAEVIAVTRDTIEFEVQTPPADREAAMQLAREQFTYCPDIVQQGTETLEHLAASLLNGRYWFFWWD